MGKNRKKQEREATPAPVTAQDADPVRQEDDPSPALPEEQSPHETRPPAPAAPAARPRTAPGRLRRWLPDLAKAVAALGVIAVAAAIWYQPPLTPADFPYLSYQFQGQTLTDAQLFRPLAMPTRYYIRLPKKLADRYEWFAVDRRREVVALTLAPGHRFLGRDAVKRSDPLGLDLEFRKLDHSEWQVHFLTDAIVFSNAVLTVRMDTQPAPDRTL